MLQHDRFNWHTFCHTREGGDPVLRSDSGVYWNPAFVGMTSENLSVASTYTDPAIAPKISRAGPLRPAGAELRAAGVKAGSIADPLSA